MLSMEQYKIIEEQLQKDNVTEFIKVLIGRYAISVENIGELLSYIPKLAEKQLEIKQKRINQSIFMGNGFDDWRQVYSSWKI